MPPFAPVLIVAGVLAGILDDAVTDRKLPRNPARGVSLPRKTKKRRVYLTHTQVQILADSAGDRRSLVYTLAYTGLRWGEATGLPVRDVDALRRRLAVNENAVNVGGRIVVGSPKTHEVRSVPFPEFLAEQLAAECTGKRPEQLVFGDGDRHLRSPDSRDGWFVNAIARAKLTDAAFPHAHDPRPQAHRGEPRDQRRREREGRAADARSRLGRDDSRHLRGPVR
ncbi:MAG TPA: hypothetical protein VNJ54_15255 [Plantibacter sp.]|uniref:tyrosine-type recombinase/integrase n=1 Tax=unclassified Plantibacter TaxID=2624265 RepID=UPI002CB7DDD7|nr:hypothetical protein [Plantibacter sp.]